MSIMFTNNSEIYFEIFISGHSHSMHPFCYLVSPFFVVVIVAVVVVVVVVFFAFITNDNYSQVDQILAVLSLFSLIKVAR